MSMRVLKKIHIYMQIYAGCEKSLYIMAYHNQNGIYMCQWEMSADMWCIGNAYVYKK